MKRLYAVKIGCLLLVLSLCAAARVFAEDRGLTAGTLRGLAGTWSLSLTGMAKIGSLKQISQDINLLVMRFIGGYSGNK